MRGRIPNEIYQGFESMRMAEKKGQMNTEREREREREIAQSFMD